MKQLSAATLWLILRSDWLNPGHVTPLRWQCGTLINSDYIYTILPDTGSRQGVLTPIILQCADYSYHVTPLCTIGQDPAVAFLY